MRIGLLSDTHLPNVIHNLDELGPEPAKFFGSVGLILHAGDMTSPAVLDWLEQFAPVICALGNNDPIADHRCKDVQVVEVEGWSIGMVHNLDRQFRPISELQKTFPAPVDVMVSGHTHQELLEQRGGVVQLNSGSITFPHHKELRLGTVGLLELDHGELHAEIIVLGETPDRPNPGRAMTLDIQDNQLRQRQAGSE